MKLLSKNEFIALMLNLPDNVKSITGEASYSHFKVIGNEMNFIRDNSGKSWLINLDELFNAYQKLDKINTVLIQKYVTGQVYSPACAILISLGLYNQKGKRVN